MRTRCVETEKCKLSFDNCNNTCNTSEDKKSHICYNHVQNNTKTGQLEVKWAGCLSTCTEDKTKISHNECNLYFHSTKEENHSYFCCCTGDLCNRNIKLNETNMMPPPTPPSSTVATSPTENTSTNSIKLFYTVAPPAIGVVLLVAVIIHLYRRHKRRMSSVARRSLVQSGNPPTPPSTRPISWGPRVSYGQFGCVWRATYENNDVAVKVILAQERASWETERNMYENYSLVHENILKFYRAEKRLVECNMFQYWIITQYHNHGSLSDYLRSNSLNFDGMLRLMISMVKGLAFLHTENLLLNPPKPIIAHRDFKSRNVLVRDDLTCCISDFGSACAFSDTYESDDTKSQVGTKRYMAPEVLQGAIAFQVESFLNIDVYALALVLWELLSRCNLSNVQVDQVYQAPYEKEVGKNPTIDEMRTCVLDNKLRPILKPEWRHGNRVDEICNTIEECWDDEGDARLSAHCVHARLIDLQMREDEVSLASSGFVESSFMDYEVDLSSSKTELQEDSYSSVQKDPLLVDLSC